jgi:histidinol-phosphate aminotransferase
MKASLSRRSFLRDSALFAGVASSASLPLLAKATGEVARAPAASAATLPIVEISANEHADGPAPAALKAMAEIAPRGGRYLHDVQIELLTELSQQLGVGTR